MISSLPIVREVTPKTDAQVEVEIDELVDSLERFAFASATLATAIERETQPRSPSRRTVRQIRGVAEWTSALVAFARDEALAFPEPADEVLEDLEFVLELIDRNFAASMNEGLGRSMRWLRDFPLAYHSGRVARALRQIERMKSDRGARHVARLTLSEIAGAA